MNNLNLLFIWINQRKQQLLKTIAEHEKDSREYIVCIGRMRELVELTYRIAYQDYEAHSCRQHVFRRTKRLAIKRAVAEKSWQRQGRKIKRKEIIKADHSTKEPLIGDLFEVGE